MRSVFKPVAHDAQRAETPPHGGVRLFAACRDGVTALEFALVSPIFFLVLMGLLEFGIFAWNQHSLEFATEETARVVMTRTTITADEVKAEVKARVSGIDAEALTTTVSQDTVGTTNFVTISVSYNYTFFLIGDVVGIEPVLIASKTRVPLRQTE